MSTAQDIIDLGFAKSSASRPETMTESAELVARIGEALQECFQELAREHPQVLGTIADVDFDGTGWPRPADCMRVIKVVAAPTTIVSPALATGDDINVVPFDDLLICEGLASITEWGQRFIPTGLAVQTMDPTGGPLRMFYARSAQRPAAPSDPIDPLFPAYFDDYLANDIQVHLAGKDERLDDVTLFTGYKNDVLAKIVRWAQGQTYSIVQRNMLVTPPATNTGGGRQAPLKDGS